MFYQLLLENLLLMWILKHEVLLEMMHRAENELYVQVLYTVYSMNHKLSYTSYNQIWFTV